MSYRAATAVEALDLFEKLGVRVAEVRAICGWCGALRLPRETQKARAWQPDFFDQTVRMVLRLSREPAASGMSRHLVVYGEKRQG